MSKKFVFDPDLKKQWVDALRSGKYKQGRASLQKDGKFCCLGVLCEVLIENGSELVKRIDTTTHWATSTSYLLDNLDPDPYFRMTSEENSDIDVIRKNLGMTAKIENRLMSMNDSGKSFEKIADYIEEKL